MSWTCEALLRSGACTPVAWASNAAKRNDQPGRMGEQQALPATSPSDSVWRAAGTFIPGAKSGT